ncbi:MAG: HDIG domain-containing metalloprotein [Cyanobacteria bacterium P01_A01_bin.84]
MKTQPIFQSLTDQINNWGQKYRALRRLYLLKTSRKEEQHTLDTVSLSAKSVKNKRGIYAVSMDYIPERSPVIFAIAVLSLTGIMGHKYYNQPHLQVGAIAPETIYAPYKATVENRQETEYLRENASQNSLPVLMLDVSVTNRVKQNLAKHLDKCNQIRAKLGPFPFFDTFLLSVSTQHYLRSAPLKEWEALLRVINNQKKDLEKLISEQKQTITNVEATIQESENNATLLGNKLEETAQIDFFAKSDFSNAVTELTAYRLRTSQNNLSALIEKIVQARQKFAIAKKETINSQDIHNESSLLELGNEEWTQTQIGIRRSAELILTQGIAPGLPQDLLKSAVSLQVQHSVPKQAHPLAINILLSVLKTNLTKDTQKTELRAKKAAAQVQPVKVIVQRNQIIVRKGNEITQLDFDILESYKLNRREINWRSLIALGIMVTGSVGLFALTERRIKHKMRQSDRILILLLTLSTPLIAIVGTPYTTWSGVGLLLGSFYGPVAGVVTIVLLLFLLPISLEISKVALLAGAAGGILGSLFAKKLRSREELALLGLAIALTEGGVFLIIRLIVSAAYGSAGYFVLQEAALFALSGLAWSIVALGLSPYLEKIFDLVTPIRLAELSNPNRPLLKRLATETPGTFQHTLLVATLAEAAAKKLGCDVELVRAGTLYHDIGKMHDPQGFIENQMGGPNKHDTEIKDPWKSTEIIKKHVSAGITMARKHSLPSAVQAFIPEHQGTMLIAYFHHQAQQMAKENSDLEIDETYFRYSGPTPQSRETGIVMLADSCEAALRSLRDATPEQALVMVNNIMRGRWQDNQLLESGLTRQELSQIAEIFVEVWQQFHHKRIAYPKAKSAAPNSNTNTNN